MQKARCWMQKINGALDTYTEKAKLSVVQHDNSNSCIKVLQIINGLVQKPIKG